MILRQPASLTVNIGQGAEFSVAAAGAEPLLYSWMKDGQPLAASGAPSYSIDVASSPDAGGYQCLVTGPGGSALSSVATLAILDPPAENDAMFLAHSAPATLDVGREIIVGIAMKNVSEISWSAAQGYSLAVVDDPSSLFEGATRIQLPDRADVVPSGSGVGNFVALLRAPAQAGVYTAQLSMVEDGEDGGDFFGEPAIVSIQAVEPPNAAGHWAEYE